MKSSPGPFELRECGCCIHGRALPPAGPLITVIIAGVVLALIIIVNLAGLITVITVVAVIAGRRSGRGKLFSAW
jgi:hypothetical protein